MTRIRFTAGRPLWPRFRWLKRCWCWLLGHRRPSDVEVVRQCRELVDELVAWSHCDFCGRDVYCARQISRLQLERAPSSLAARLYIQGLADEAVDRVWAAMHKPVWRRR